MRILAALVLALCLSSCDRRDGPEGGDAARWDGTVQDSAGVTVVRNHGTPLWGEASPWSFTPLLDVGLSDDDLSGMFGSISSVAWLSDGTVAVADRFAHNVRFFSLDGSLLESVGREGSGPKEFRELGDLLVGPNDTIVALDWGTLRASRITSDGAWHGSFSMAPEGGFYQGWWAADPTTSHLASRPANLETVSAMRS